MPRRQQLLTGWTLDPAKVEKAQMRRVSKTRRDNTPFGIPASPNTGTQPVSPQGQKKHLHTSPTASISTLEKGTRRCAHTGAKASVMPQRKMLPGHALAAVTLLAVASLAAETRPLVGLDLVEDRTAEMMESMKAGMVSRSSVGGCCRECQHCGGIKVFRAASAKTAFVPFSTNNSKQQRRHRGSVSLRASP